MSSAVRHASTPGSARAWLASTPSSLASAVGDSPLALEDLKVIVLMVFWSLGEEPDALILDELFVAPEERLIH